MADLLQVENQGLKEYAVKVETDQEGAVGRQGSTQCRCKP
jgi:hypothetical protein